MGWLEDITEAQVGFEKLRDLVASAIRSGQPNPELDQLIQEDVWGGVYRYVHALRWLVKTLVFNPHAQRLVRKKIDAIEKGFFMGRVLTKPAKFSNDVDHLPRYKHLKKVLDAFRKESHTILDDVFPAPRTFTALGMKFSTNQEFPVSNLDAQDVVRGVARAKKVFKDRGLLDLFFDSLTKIELSGADQGGTMGLYYSHSRKIELLVPQMARGSISSIWGDDTVLYVFVHEVAHHIHMDYMTKEAQDFWNEPWTKELSPKKEQLKAQPVEPHTTYESRSKWMRLILQEGVAGAGKKLKGVERQIFKGWLMAANLIKKLPKQTRLESSEKAMLLENLHRNYVGDLSDEDFKIYLKSLSLNLDIDRPLLTILETFPLYRILMGSLGVKDTNTEKLPSSVVNLLEIPNIPPDPALQEEVRRLFNLHRTTYDIPTEYAMTDQYEDFAESFTDYMLNPGRVNAEGKWRTQRALWLSGYGGKPVAERLASRRGRAKARPQRHV